MLSPGSMHWFGSVLWFCSAALRLRRVLRASLRGVTAFTFVLMHYFSDIKSRFSSENPRRGPWHGTDGDVDREGYGIPRRILVIPVVRRLLRRTSTIIVSGVAAHSARVIVRVRGRFRRGCGGPMGTIGGCGSSEDADEVSLGGLASEATPSLASQVCCACDGMAQLLVPLAILVEATRMAPPEWSLRCCVGSRVAR
jgi:hypothetical protein